VFDRLEKDYETPPVQHTEEVQDVFEGRIDGLYIILISLHGLVRGDRMELGKDPDTGGQVCVPTGQSLGDVYVAQIHTSLPVCHTCRTGDGQCGVVLVRFM
jgi:hypothetical protein